MVVVLSRFVAFTNRHPIVRGMISYATIWPVSNIIQQSLAGKQFDSLDWNQVAQFAFFGSFYVAPSLYAWVRISSVIWPQNNFKTGVIKAVVEQFTFGPFAITSFHFWMSIMDGKTFDESVDAVRQKFFPTWKVGMCYWAVLQSINFTWISEKNRVPFVSCCSLVWCCFLSYMHQLQLKQKEKELTKLAL
ncbi:mpv17-like protein isoform X4 [Coccinella septempunctata]|uniref:mpv17-like protein isoform X4 n=1 Tax=Coccinella septempunctata TaxID=41139 RepID=UPI001D0880AA|nr:mpv17-like protein isoform X4 [Coccinella septempunctata]